MKVKNIGFLASRHGTIMQAVFDACASGELLLNPTVLITNNPNCEAIKRAAQANVPAFCLNAKIYPNSAELDQAISDCLSTHQVDLVFLAGYIKKVSAITLQQFKNRMINIHPALLPKFGGQGMYGDNVHKTVIEAGEIETGITVHFVDEIYDYGKIIAQKRLPVFS